MIIYIHGMRQTEIENRKTYSQDSLVKYFTDPQHYKKIGTVEARLARKGEMIATVIDGKIETINHAGADDVVVKNPSGEEYILAMPSFTKRYRGPEPSPEYQTFHATGTTYAVEWHHGPATFKASWGEMMIIDDGDYLCSVTEEPEGDLYRIEAGAFAETYREIDDDL